MKTALLVASSGGHLNQLYQLREGWSRERRLWVTFHTSDAKELLGGERVVYAYYPTNRSLLNLVRNTLLAARLIVRVRPGIVITTGAAIAVPFTYVAWLFRIAVIYVEGLGRVENLSLSARLAAPAVTRLFVQWPELVGKHAKAEYRGTLL
jgi:beta-1,4-N-acetylglucosaminyltransferase